MNVAIGVDHAGFPLKELVSEVVVSQGHTVVDLGTMDTNPVDYPDVARDVALAVTRGEASCGILVCGSGIGASVAANKVPGIRAGLAHDSYSARQGVEHDAMNVLCMGARVVGPAAAEELVRQYLGAAFTGEARHVRRIEKVQQMEATDWQA